MDKTSRELIESTIESQYNRLWLRATMGHLLGAVSGRPWHLRGLAEALQDRILCGQHDEGLKQVRLDRIVGSEGRWRDFDCGFRPLRTHSHRRWISVARAQAFGVNLPPVSLIKIADDYYVRDGNHRVSVARAFGLKSIEATVTVYELARQEQTAGAAATAMTPAHAGA